LEELLWIFVDLQRVYSLIHGWYESEFWILSSKSERGS